MSFTVSRVSLIQQPTRVMFNKYNFSILMWSASKVKSPRNKLPLVTSQTSLSLNHKPSLCMCSCDYYKQTNGVLCLYDARDQYSPAQQLYLCLQMKSDTGIKGLKKQRYRCNRTHPAEVWQDISLPWATETSAKNPLTSNNGSEISL